MGRELKAKVVTANDDSDDDQPAPEAKKKSIHDILKVFFNIYFQVVFISVLSLLFLIKHVII